MGIELVSKDQFISLNQSKRDADQGEGNASPPYVEWSEGAELSASHENEVASSIDDVSGPVNRLQVVDEVTESLLKPLVVVFEGILVVRNLQHVDLLFEVLLCCIRQIVALIVYEVLE